MTTTNKRTIEIPGATLTFIARRPSYGDRSYTSAPRMYVDVKDETIFDNLANRKRRPYNVYKTLLWSLNFKGVLRLGKLQWSQYAGCSCPCSPGFILPSQRVVIGGESTYYFDVWVTLEGAPAVDEAKAPRIPIGV